MMLFSWSMDGVDGGMGPSDEAGIITRLPPFPPAPSLRAAHGTAFGAPVRRSGHKMSEQQIDPPLTECRWREGGTEDDVAVGPSVATALTKGGSE